MKFKKLFALITILCALCLGLAACGGSDGGNKQDPPAVKTYTVSFETNGGKPLGAIEWKAGTAIKLPTPERDGYDFAGWYYDEALDNAVVVAAFTTDRDCTLYAAWKERIAPEPIVYTITFVTYGDPLAPVEKPEGEMFVAPLPTRDGFEFKGWYFDTAFMKPVPEKGFAVSQDSTLYADWQYIINKYKIRLYTTENDYTEWEYAPDDVVDISKWIEPEPITFEGDGCPFMYWIDETYTHVVEENFAMPKRSLAYYAVYDMPQRYHWAYDADNDIYTSDGAGVRPVKNAAQSYYGELSAEFTVTDPATSGVGLVFNADISENDYPYDYTSGSTYWYFHVNPSKASGGFQIARVVDSYNALQTITKNKVPAWNAKHTAYHENVTAAGLRFTVRAVFLPDSIELYIDDEKVYTYDGEYMNTVYGKTVGIRTSRAGVTAENIVWTPSETYAEVKKISYATGKDDVAAPTAKLWATATDLPLPEIAQNGWESTGWYVDAAREIPATKENIPSGSEITLYAAFRAVVMKNGYKIYDDRYVYNTSGLSVVAVDELDHEYGKWSADFTATSKSVGRIGLIFQAAVADTDGTLAWGANDMKGYMYYLNLGACKSIEYSDTGTISGIAYPTFAKVDVNDKGVNGYISMGNTHNAADVINNKLSKSGVYGKFYSDVYDFFKGTSATVTVRLGIAVTPTRIVLYLNDIPLKAIKNPGKIEGGGGRMGFYTEGNGEFSAWKYEAVEEQNGFIITTDESGKKTYQSAGISETAFVTVALPEVSARYGKLEADVDVSYIKSTGAGLVAQTSIPTGENGSEVLRSLATHNAYYLYHNQGLNENFTLASVVNGKYTTGGTVKKYTADTEGALGAYQKRNALFNTGAASSVKVRMGIEITPTEINIYIDGEKIITNTTYGGKFDDNNDCTGWGFVGYGVSARFENIVFTPFETTLAA